jgi:DnaJ-class molecular chaperone
MSPRPRRAMIAYVGARRETEVAVMSDDLGCGAGVVTCFECKGRGVWDYMEPEIPAGPCVSCKGTGKVFVAI